MNDEIIPEMLKFTSQSLNDKKGDLNAEDLDFNPEWEEYMKESGIDNKIKEISELQLEGADVLMGTFANLKSFPFFNKMSNWFIPFYNDNSNIATVFEDQETGETFKNMFETSRFMCNSDKYSFCLSILMLPHNQRSMMSQQFALQINDLKVMEKV